MPNEKNNLYLLEAVELRSEYDARIKTLSSLLPENREREGFLSRRNSEYNVEKPVESFDIEKVRSKIKTLRTKRRKLNNEIQKTNFNCTTKVRENTLTLAEVLELRKQTNEDIKELASQLKESAYAKIIYKEERDIVKKPRRDFTEVEKEFEEKRLLFRSINRALHQANHEHTVNFKDE
ncbi:MAG: hypothetical protein U9O41_01585 [Candidatus Aerophobetes bacterium]|nr:hypothetical protein [Candidatus Aerophobetes bacterium]